MNKIVYRMNRILSLHGAQIYLQHENIILTREKIISMCVKGKEFMGRNDLWVFDIHATKKVCRAVYATEKLSGSSMPSR